MKKKVVGGKLFPFILFSFLHRSWLCYVHVNPVLNFPEFVFLLSSGFDFLQAPRVTAGHNQMKKWVGEEKKTIFGTKGKSEGKKYYHSSIYLCRESRNSIQFVSRNNFIFPSQVLLVRYFKIILWSCYLVFRPLYFFLLNAIHPPGPWRFFVPYN